MIGNRLRYRITLLVLTYIETTNTGMNTGINGLTNVGEVLTFQSLESACVRLGHMYTLDWRFSRNPKNRFWPLNDGSQETQRTDSDPRLTGLKKPKEPILTLDWRFSRTQVPTLNWGSISSRNHAKEPTLNPRFFHEKPHLLTYLLTYL